MQERISSGSWLFRQPLLDSALPIGGFSHSFGLETLVQEGRVQSVADLQEYCRSMMRHAWAPADCLLIKQVYEFAAEFAEGKREDWQGLWRCDHRLHVQRVARETREGMQKMGRRLYQLAGEIYPDLPWFQLEDGIRSGACPGSYPLIHGWLSFHLGAPLDAAAEGYLYNSLQHAINAALRLMSIGQTQGQKLLVSLLPECVSAWRSVQGLSFSEAYTACPEADIAMMRHEQLYSRLFMS